MEVDIKAVREVLDGVETNLKKALREVVMEFDTNRLHNQPHIETALESVQKAITELLLVR